MTFRLFKLEIRCTSATVESISKTSPGKTGRDADLVVMVDCQIPSDDLIVHFF